MATRALTAMARRKSPDRASTEAPHSPCPDWRQVLVNQDASAAWQKIFELVKSSGLNLPDPTRTTQDVFLELLISGRLQLYEDQYWSDDEVERDILEMILR